MSGTCGSDMGEALTSDLMNQYVMPNYGRFAIEFVKGKRSV